METSTTISLEIAKRYVCNYNQGVSNGRTNPDIDRQARNMFDGGLGVTRDEILKQVKFIGQAYGGVSVQQRGAITSISPAIADDIFRNRAGYEGTARQARPLLEQMPSRNTIDILYLPFTNKPFSGSRNWLTWGSKFWHFLNPEAFPIADSRVKAFFGLAAPVNSAGLYLELVKRFREFILRRKDWLPTLRQVDQCSCPAWCDIKLWDKMCYGSAEKKT